MPITPGLPQGLYGASYDELWPEEVSEGDICPVREFGSRDLLGRSLSPGEYGFPWLDLVVDLFYGGSVLILEEGRA